MLQYEIAGIKFCIDHNKSSNFNRLKFFESNFSTGSDILIRFKVSESFVVPNFMLPQNDILIWHSEINNNEVSTYLYNRRTRRFEYKITADQNWTDVTIHYDKRTKNIEKTFCLMLGNFIISNKVIFHSGLVLHASSIACSGKGIAFTASSGTGKSTHTTMWEKYYGASVLNDDCPIIRYENDQTNIYGTPWNGSKNKSKNASTQLNAIVFIERASQNSIMELTDKEVIPLLLPRIYLPYRNAELMDAAFQNIEKIMQNIPKYLLRCRPDREAVELVHRCII